MNVIFISPTFPPQFFHFCTALRKYGATVLGLGEAPPSDLGDELRGALSEYICEPNLRFSEAAHRAVAHLSWKYGPIDRIDSHNEFWLGIEAQLREDFDIPGPRPAQLRSWRTKSGMANVFSAIGIPSCDGVLATSPTVVRAFAKAHGYPLVLKPDQGVGAAGTFKVKDEQELALALEQPLEGYLVQSFVKGDIVSYDGLVDAEGRIVFETAHAYSSGIMEVVRDRLDVSYWSCRDLNPQLRDLGQRTVAGFQIRERFFHTEFFRTPDGNHRALEINVRPPGGFTTDMMNYTADIDVYDLWARMLVGQDVSDFAYSRKYHVAHVSRRSAASYRHMPHEVERRLGERLLWHRDVPAVLSGAMGEEMFLVRHPKLDVVKEDIAFIQQPAQTQLPNAHSSADGSRRLQSVSP